MPIVDLVAEVQMLGLTDLACDVLECLSSQRSLPRRVRDLALVYPVLNTLWNHQVGEKTYIQTSDKKEEGLLDSRINHLKVLAKKLQKINEEKLAKAIQNRSSAGSAKSKVRALDAQVGHNVKDSQAGHNVKESHENLKKAENQIRKIISAADEKIEDASENINQDDDPVKEAEITYEVNENANLANEEAEITYEINEHANIVKEEANDQTTLMNEEAEVIKTGNINSVNEKGKSIKTSSESVNLLIEEAELIKEAYETANTANHVANVSDEPMRELDENIIHSNDESAESKKGTNPDDDQIKASGDIVDQDDQSKPPKENIIERSSLKEFIADPIKAPTIERKDSFQSQNIDFERLQSSSPRRDKSRKVFIQNQEVKKIIELVEKRKKIYLGIELLKLPEKIHQEIIKPKSTFLKKEVTKTGLLPTIPGTNKEKRIRSFYPTQNIYRLKKANSEGAFEEIRNHKFQESEQTEELSIAHLNVIKVIFKKSNTKSIHGLFMLLWQKVSSGIKMNDKRFINSILVDILLQEIALFVSVYLDSKVHIEYEPSQIVILSFLELIFGNIAYDEKVADLLGMPIIKSLVNLIQLKDFASSLISPACNLIKLLSYYPNSKILLGEDMPVFIARLEKLFHLPPDESHNNETSTLVKIFQNITGYSEENRKYARKLGILPLLKSHFSKKHKSYKIKLGIIKLINNLFGDSETVLFFEREFWPMLLDFSKSITSPRDLIPFFRFIHNLSIALESKASYHFLNSQLDFLIHESFKLDDSDVAIFVLFHDFSFACIGERYVNQEKRLITLIHLLLKGIGVGTKLERGKCKMVSNQRIAKEALKALINFSFHDNISQAICFEAGHPLFEQLVSMHKKEIGGNLPLALIRNLCIDQLACQHILDCSLDHLVNLMNGGKENGRLECFQIIRNITLQGEIPSLRIHCLPQLIPELLINLSLPTSMVDLQKCTMEIIEYFINLKQKTHKKELVMHGVPAALLALNCKSKDPAVKSKAALLYNQIKIFGIHEGDYLDPFSFLISKKKTKKINSHSIEAQSNPYK